MATPHMAPAAAQALLVQLQHVRRYMLYCQGLRHHRPEQQRKHWKDMLGLREWLTTATGVMLTPIQAAVALALYPAAATGSEHVCVLHSQHRSMSPLFAGCC
jgi:hypothetical protein